MGDMRYKVRDAILLSEGYISIQIFTQDRVQGRLVKCLSAPRLGSPRCMLETQQGKFEMDLSDLSRVIWSILVYVYMCKRDAED